MGTPRLRVILPTEVEALWPEISSRLLAAEDFSQGEFLISDLLPMVQRQEAFIAAMDNKTELDLIVVFQIMTFPRKKVLHVLAMGGQGFDVIMKSCWPELEKLALFLGTSAIRAAVRPSMQRYARRVAPEAVPVYTVIERSIGA